MAWMTKTRGRWTIKLHDGSTRWEIWDERYPEEPVAFGEEDSPSKNRRRALLVVAALSMKLGGKP
jgi:hypothetical protein